MTKRYYLVLVASILITQVICQLYIYALGIESLVVATIGGVVGHFIANQKGKS